MKLKVCGLKYKDNIEQIAQLNVDYMGFIFYAKSKRFVGDDFIMPAINRSIKKVGVFVNADINYILEKVTKYHLSAVQLHGDETALFCEQIKEQLLKNETLNNVEVIKAFGIDDTFDFTILNDYSSDCNYFLFDTKTKDYGGSGHQFNWDVLAKYKLSLPYFLSGGIGLQEIETIKKEMPQLNMFAIDVNSKFELEPGLKDINMIKQLVNRIK